MNDSKTMGVIRLMPALQYVFPMITNGYYMIDQETKEEYVIIWYKFDYKRQKLKVCVTCDSVQAMFDDVWKECKRRFS